MLAQIVQKKLKRKLGIMSLGDTKGLNKNKKEKNDNE